MPCRHKFYDNLYIEYAKDCKPITLIVGTFNPEWPEKNYAQWFYGRTENNFFWEVLPGLYNTENLRDEPVDRWKSFCKDNKIALTDLIAEIKTADRNNANHYDLIASYSDKNIEENFAGENDLVTVDIVRILQENKSIKYVFLTRGAQKQPWRSLWKPVKEFCKQNGIIVKELLTPSGYAFYQYSKKEREQFDSLSDFITGKWRNKFHQIH